MLSETVAEHAPFHVVFVCTGNRARSPLAEVFLRAKVDSGAVRVESYGTLELGPAPATPEAIAAASHSASTFVPTALARCVESALPMPTS